MAKLGKVDLKKLSRKRFAILLGVVVLVGGAIVWGQSFGSPDDQPPPASVPSAGDQPLEVRSSSDYSKRVVAYLGTEAITRQELGDYLVARKGKSMLPLLINRRIMERACRERGIEVTAMDVENSFREGLDGIVGVPKQQFVKQMLEKYGKTLYEWKEDIIRPKLMLQRLCRNRIRITDEAIHKAFESRYGEKVDCRIIIWPKEKKKEAQQLYGAIRKKEEAFHEAAKNQSKSEYASCAGNIKPISRYSLEDPKVEEIAMKLRPGEVSELIDTEMGIVVLKCDRRIPADSTASLEAKRKELIQELIQKQLRAAMPKMLDSLEKDAKSRTIVEDFTQPANPGQVVAIIFDREPITREELGEFLIARYGAAKLSLMVNRRIIQRACKKKGISVSDGEIEAELASDLKALEADLSVFKDKYLKPQGTSLYEWKEDVIRQRLLMDRYVRPTVKATPEEMQKAFDAYYGERVECRIIMWPKGEERTAMMEYDKLRDSEKEFAHKAKHQANSKLASRGGKLDEAVGRNTTGNEELERELFSLEPGQVSRLIGTPQGTVMLKCDKRIPANKNVKLEQVKAKLVAEIIRKKVKIEIPAVFAELREQVQPRLLLTGPEQVEDLAASVERELRDSKRALDAVGAPASR